MGPQANPIADPGKQERRAEGLPIVPAFDGYRAYAILGVVAIHVLLASGVTASAGGSALGQLIWGTVGQAVDILFIVSGFVVFLPTVARGRFGGVGNYAIRRVARIVPAYWLALILLLIVMAISTPAPLAYPSLSSIALHATFLQTPAFLVQQFGGEGDRYGFGIDNPVWTLSVEMGFYLVLPFIAVAYLRRPLIGLAICAAVAVGWRELFHHLDWVAGLFGGNVTGPDQVRYRLASDDQLPFWAFSFGCGMTGAWAFVRLRERFDTATIRRYAGPAQLVSVLFVALFVYLAGRYARTVTPPFTATIARQSSLIALGYSGAIALFMVVTALVADRRQRLFSATPVRRVGDISYGIYLSHFAIAVYVGQVLSPIHNGSLAALAVWSVLVFPLAGLYGYLSARYLEVPIRRWARRYGRREVPASTTASG